MYRMVVAGWVVNLDLDGIFTRLCLFDWVSKFKGQWGVPLTVCPWCLLCSLGILRDYNP